MRVATMMRRGPGHRVAALLCASALMSTVTWLSPIASRADVPRIGVLVAGGSMGTGLNQLSDPEGLALDPQGKLLIADTGNNRVLTWPLGALDGVFRAGTGTASFSDSSLARPTDVAVVPNASPAGDIEVSDSDNARILEWPTGWPSGMTKFGGNGAGPATNQLDMPTALAVTPWSDTYVADCGNNRVMVWSLGSTSGVAVAGAGAGLGSGPGSSLRCPSGVAVDGHGTLYVADSGNNRVLSWTYGTKTGAVVAGGSGSSADFADLNNPHGLAVDKSGDLFIADTGNNRIVEWLKGANQGVVVAGGVQGPGLTQL